MGEGNFGSGNSALRYRPFHIMTQCIGVIGREKIWAHSFAPEKRQEKMLVIRKLSKQVKRSGRETRIRERA